MIDVIIYGDLINAALLVSEQLLLFLLNWDRRVSYEEMIAVYFFPTTFGRNFLLKINFYQIRIF